MTATSLSSPGPRSVMHLIEPQSMGEPAVTRCCGVPVSTLPRADRLTWHPDSVTCLAISGNVAARIERVPVGWLMPASLGSDARAVPVWEWPDGTLRLTNPSAEEES